MRSIIRRELALVMRNGAIFSNPLGFFALVVLITPLGLSADPSQFAVLSTSILWIATLLVGILSVEHFFKNDFDDGVLEMLIASPIPLENIVLAKSFSHWLIIGVPVTFCGALAAFLFSGDAKFALWSAISLGLGTPALSMIGVFGATLTLKRGGLLISVLVLPMSVPVLIFGSQSIIRASMGGNIISPLSVLVAISLACGALLPYASAAVLKISLR